MIPAMSANPKVIPTSVRERVSKQEWDMRVDLAAAYQRAHLFRWTDLIYTHFSARVPGTEDFLINPYGLMFDEITASNLVKIDWDGKVLGSAGLGFGGDFQFYAAIQCGDFQFTTQYRIDKINRYFAIQIVAIALEERMRGGLGRLHAGSSFHVYVRN